MGGEQYGARSGEDLCDKVLSLGLWGALGGDFKKGSDMPLAFTFEHVPPNC